MREGIGMTTNVSGTPRQDKIGDTGVNGCSEDTFEEMPENIYETLKNTSALYPGKRAFIEQGRVLTYGEFKRLVDVFSENLFHKFQVKKGDRVALLMVNSIDFCISFYALTKLGAIVLPMSTKSKQIELERLLIDSGARLLILNEKWWGNVRDSIPKTEIEKCIVSGVNTDSTIGIHMDELLRSSREVSSDYTPVKAEDTAILIYTSGTTGMPKGALLSHQNILHGLISYKKVLGLTKDDSTVIAVPIFHITGLAALMALFVYIGGSMVLEPYFNADKTLNIIDEHKITFFHASPTIFIMLLEEAEKYKEVPSLRKAACGSANMPPPVLEKLKQWIPNMDFRTVYGLTETSSPATIMPDDVYVVGKIGSSGSPIPGFRIKVIDEGGRERPANKVGELLVKGKNVLKRYWNEEQNKDAFLDGWFRTGDYAKIDQDGFLYIVDRKKDMINRGGEKIYSIEVENILYCHPAIKEVALIGVPDSIYGEVGKAIISLNKGYDLTVEEVKKWVSERLAKFKVPQYVEFIDKMPHTNNGKVSKTMIKKLYSN
jgi:long-chain acyl-CoA synthetase